MADFMLIVAVVLSVPGLFANSLIIISNVIQCHFKKPLQTIGVILTATSVGNLLTGIMNLVMVLLLSWTSCPPLVLSFLWELSEGLPKWGITITCIFFYFRVVPHSNAVLLWLKSRFPLVAAVTLLFGYAWSLATSVIDVLWQGSSSGAPQYTGGNCSSIALPSNVLVVKICLKYVSLVLAVTLMLLSSGALMLHLFTHVKRMRGNGSEMTQVRQDGVLKVAVMILFLALVFLSYLGSRYFVTARGQYVMTTGIQRTLCVSNLALSTIIPCTFIAGVSTQRHNAATLLFGK